MVKHDAAKGASGSNLSEEVTQKSDREEQVDPVVPRREQSKDMISAFDLRLTQVEDDVSGMEAQVDNLGQRVKGLEAEDAAIHTAIKGNLRTKLIKECHDSLWAGHPGIRRTLALLKSTYYWPRMRDGVEEYVRTCVVCQQDKEMFWRAHEHSRSIQNIMEGLGNIRKDREAFGQL
ncbi:hypothetical protein ACLB2K_030555 [Fragaria x ananassa]